MRNSLWSTILVCVLAMILMIGCVAPAPPPSNPTAVSATPTLGGGNGSAELRTLRIGHNWTGEKLKVLESAVADYEAHHPTTKVVLQGEFANEQILTTLPAGKAPDIFIAAHDFGGQLFQKGYLSAYCAPDGCPECTGPNPPRWCQYATSDFGTATPLLFGNGLGHCLKDCGCTSANPPVWCWFATGEKGYPGMDQFKAAFADFTGDKPFPFGTPIDWSVITVLANKDWFNERGLDEMPTTVEQLGSLVEKFNADQPVYYTDVTLDELMPSELKSAGARDQIDGAGIIVANSMALPHMDQGISRSLVPLDLEGLPPRIWVEGAYLNPYSEVKTDALDFMYELSEPTVQEALFHQAGVLPADSELLAKLADDTTLGRVISLAGVAGELAAVASSPTTLQACVDFQGYPDDTGMGMTFQVGGLTFTGLGTSEPFVNDYYITADVKVHGLQFSDAGIQIDMSGPATTINLDAFSTNPSHPLAIVALNSSGNPVDQTTVPGDNSGPSLMLTGQDITSIVITGGGGEGVLVEICVNEETQPPGVSTATVQLQEISLPPEVFSIADEALAFRAEGESGQTATVTLPLEVIQSKWEKLGGVKQISVYEFDQNGTMPLQQLIVKGDASAQFQATAGNRYLVYADMEDERYQNTYSALCTLENAGVPGALVPEICTMILCGSQVFPAADLTKRFPVLADMAIEFEGSQGLIGGFGLSGNICEQCLGTLGEAQPFFPDEDCFREALHPEPMSMDKIVYSYYGEGGVIQIMNSDGSDQRNLSRNAYRELQPDVSTDGRSIVFVGQRNSLGQKQLYIMDIEGNNAVPVPNTENAYSPVWSHGINPFIVFMRSQNTPGPDAFYRVNADGTGLTQLSSLVPGARVGAGDLTPDNQYLVFRQAVGDHLPDLYMMSTANVSSAIRQLTDTPERAEEAPVFSHDGQKLAYVVWGGGTSKIHVAHLNDVMSLTLQDEFDVPLATDFSIDFSSDDMKLYFSAPVEDSSPSPQRRYEIFSVRLDGTELQRLTTNEYNDVDPSTVPQ